MLALGKFNSLVITEIRDHQLVLEGGELGEIVCVETPPDDQILDCGSSVDVFVYIDGHNKLIATCKAPKAQADEVAWLKVVSVSHTGAFLDWGMPKDLLVPFSEQKNRLIEGQFCLVRVFLDENNRIVASEMLNDFIQDEGFYLSPGQAVDIIIAEETDLGIKAVVNHKYWGLLYKNEVFQVLKKGQRLTAYIKTIRPDKKIDLILTQDKYGAQVDQATQKILHKLKQQNGFIAVTDKSPPELIYQIFAVSKKVFKQAIGGLYKQRKITIEDNGIRLVK